MSSRDGTVLHHSICAVRKACTGQGGNPSCTLFGGGQKSLAEEVVSKLVADGKIGVRGKDWGKQEPVPDEHNAQNWDSGSHLGSSA